MSMDRRKFLKIAGISSVLGLGASVVSAKGPSLLTGMDPSQVDKNKEALLAKRWAMVVDMSKFKTEEDFKKVIDACHLTHNVPDFRNADGSVDKKFEVKWIWTAPYERTFPGQDNKYMSEHMKEMPFLVACNHCDNPPCVRVCPTKATFKLPNGITMQDEHRCIGCRFCMAACPYGSRSFNWRDPRPAIKSENKEYPTRSKGVVEKCTFCTERLAVGKLPACVEAAPKGGLLFGDLEDPNSEVRKIVTNQYTIRRKSDLGTGPGIYYIVGGSDHA
ncbi:MAG: 4Fe-4S dicluster domain-containing protein [Nitrospirae bacterium]|nr:4Fe-4S dicluster domain-containing protein [Nitrospirota bacterium]